MFGKKRVKFIPLGMMVGIQCPCGQAGLNQTSPDPGEVPAGYRESDIAKCAYCGRLFVFTDAKSRDDGVIVGQGRPTVTR